MRTRTLIVGGGLSGLALAAELERCGDDYLLVESRERIGGRVLSVGSGMGSDGTGDSVAQKDDRYDLGPAWFWPGQPRIARWIRELGLRAFEQYARGNLIFQDLNGNVSAHPLSTMAGALRLAGGLATLTEGIAATLPGDKLLVSHRLVTLAQGPSGVQATLHHGADEISIAAETCVLALPPRLAAKAIAFEPPLDASIRDAMLGIPTWMAGHAKLIAIYRRPFWRDAGLSGDGMSHLGPLAEIHDASPLSATQGALFGFLGQRSPDRTEQELKATCVAQLSAMFGTEAGKPQTLILKDWARDSDTATRADAATTGGHPAYGMPEALKHIWGEHLLLASSELANESGGLLEGALEVAATTATRIAGPHR